MACKECGEISLRRRNLFCNRKCYAGWQSKNPQSFNISEWHRKNPIESRLARAKQKALVTGLIAWNKGLQIPFKARDVTKYKNRSGENHINWKGGSWIYWRQKCLERDNYTCQKCGFRDLMIMEVDHLIPIKMTLTDRRRLEKDRQAKELGMSNLQTLCPNCHRVKSILEAEGRRKDTVHVKSR